MVEEDKNNNGVDMSGVIISGNVGGSRIFFWKSWEKSNIKIFYRLTILLIFVIIFGFVGSVYIWHKNNRSNSSPNSKENNNSVQNFQTSLNAAAQKANNVTGVGTNSYQKAISYVNAVPIASDNSTQDEDVLIEKATIALNYEQYADALKYSEEADSLSSSNTTAYLAAESAQALGQNQLAIKYYKEALSLTPATSGSNDADIRDYNQAISQLGG